MATSRESSAQSHAAPRRPQLLVVDDDPVMLRALERMLRGAHPDWAVSVAVTAFEAAERLRGARHDVLITDLDMPGTSGLDLLRHAAQRHPEVIRIVHSARVSDMGGEQLAELADVVLSKPVDTLDLITVVESSLSVPDPGQAAGQIPRSAG
jgi:CheY-like chemotaxis protein